MMQINIAWYKVFWYSREMRYTTVKWLVELLTLSFTSGCQAKKISYSCEPNKKTGAAKLAH